VRAFVQTDIGRFEERDLPVPDPREGEVILRVTDALLCGTDLKMLERGHATIALPTVMGHEACGEIVAVGVGVTAFSVGQRVVPGVSGPCGRCKECESGFSNLCPSAHADRTWGAFAEYLRVPAAVVSANLHPVPEGMPGQIAAFLDPLAAVLHGWNRLGALPRRLLVYGAGALGLLWAATARRRNVAVVVAARRPERLALARALGAEVVDLSDGASAADELSRLGFLPDAAVDATGSPEVWQALPGLLRPGGRALLFGGCAPGARVVLDAARLHYAEISLIGAFHSTPGEADRALSLLASGEIDPRMLLSGEGPLAELPNLIERQRAGDGIRYAVRPASARR
jgi:L-iditol 2-dehydrogenase